MSINFKDLFDSSKSIISKHSPEILTALGISGMIGTVIMAVKATPTAIYQIECAENEKRADLTKTEKIKTCWKTYLPTAITGTVSIACLVGASSVNVRRNAALTTAYTLSETALKEYRSKVLETVGEKKEQTIRDEIAKDRMKSQPLTKSVFVKTGKGTTNCYDIFCGRYFDSDKDLILRTENILNKRMIADDCITLNEWYYELGLPQTAVGDVLGWTMEHGFIETKFSSVLADDENPCMAIDIGTNIQYLN